MILEFAIAATLTLPKHYHLVRFDNTTSHRKACVVGTVVYKRHQVEDEDWHITLIDEKQRKLVSEIIPELPLAIPEKNDKVLICGISSKDEHHGWNELHPVIYWTKIK